MALAKLQLSLQFGDVSDAAHDEMPGQGLAVSWRI
jgi:hypothetical protein